MIRTADRERIHSKRKAVTAFFPYAVWQEQGGQHEMLETFLRTARASGRWRFMWRRIRLPLLTLLKEESPISLKRATLLASPHMPWGDFANGQHLVQLWAAATSAFPYADEISQSVVDTLLHIASQDLLRPHIPNDMWLWLNKRPLLPLVCWGRFRATQWSVIQAVRGLGNIETLKSYMLLVWSEWDYLGFLGLHEMCVSIQEEFGGIGMGHHRGDLLLRLDHILSQLDLGLEHLKQQELSLSERDIGHMRYEYKELKNVLLEVDREAGVVLMREFFGLGMLSVDSLLLNTHRFPLDLYMRDPPPPVVIYLGYSSASLIHNPQLYLSISLSCGLPLPSSRISALSPF